MRLDGTECRDRLVASRFGVLGTVDIDRGTHLVPVVFAVHGDELAIPIDTVKAKRSTNLRRLSNLRLDARASLIVEHRSDDWDALWWVRADLAFVDVQDNQRLWTERLAIRYPQYASEQAIQSIIRFRINDVSGWSAT